MGRRLGTGDSGQPAAQGDPGLRAYQVEICPQLQGHFLLPRLPPRARQERSAPHLRGLPPEVRLARRREGSDPQAARSPGERQDQGDLKNKNFSYEFYCKIRFFNIIFDSKKKALSYTTKKFISHIIDEKNPITEKDVDDLIERKNKDKYIYDKNFSRFKINDELFVQVQEIQGGEIIKFKINEYDKRLIDKLATADYDDVIINETWENNNLNSFQIHNYLLEEDIIFLKNTIKKIFKSNFWLYICDEYCDNDFININPFKNEDFVKQFFDNLIFLPFDIDNLEFYAYTTADDLCIFVSGNPFLQEKLSLKDYKLNRLLQMGVLIIVILHESIHYLKRLLNLITCDMISRKTVNDNKKEEEGGNIFEQVLFNWKKSGKNKKINIINAINLLNLKIYEKNINDIKEILINEIEYKEKDESLINYLSKLRLDNECNYKSFIQQNKKKYINASKEYILEKNCITYYRQDHRHSKE